MQHLSGAPRISCSIPPPRLGDGFVYRLLAEALFNVTGSAGYSGGITVETVTAKTNYGPIVQAASSGGPDLVTC